MELEYLAAFLETCLLLFFKVEIVKETKERQNSPKKKKKKKKEKINIK